MEDRQAPGMREKMEKITTRFRDVAAGMDSAFDLFQRPVRDTHPRYRDRSEARRDFEATGQDMRRAMEMSIPREILEEAASHCVASAPVSREFGTSLPPAQILADCERRMPGCGKIVIDNFEKIGARRRERERLGKHFAMLSLFSILALAVVCAWVGESRIGTAVAIAGLGGLFLVSRIFGASRRDWPDFSTASAAPGR